MEHIAVVTGAAGFIGSHLAERLVRDGLTVIGIDSFTDYYPRWMKERNVEWLLGQPNFTLHEIDLALDNFQEMDNLLSGAATLFHLAASPGVRAVSTGQCLQCAANNLLATERLLEWAAHTNVRKIVYASSSSVYGRSASHVMRETDRPHPRSLYGMTKLTGEHICQSWRARSGIAVVILRYFTVYGPRQRPDMAFSRFIRCLCEDRPIELFGDGSQTRDFCFVSDAVEATLLAADAPSGEIINVGSARATTVAEAVGAIETLMHRSTGRRKMQRSVFDVQRTLADISRARAILGYRPRHSLRDGLTQQIEWTMSPSTGPETERTQVASPCDPGQAC